MTIKEAHLVLYVPALHQGYLDLFRRFSGEVHGVYILGEDLIAELMPFGKEIRALDPEDAAWLIKRTGFFRSVSVVASETISVIEGNPVVLIDDEMSRRLVGKYLVGRRCVFESVFLRWDEKNVFTMDPSQNVLVSTNGFDRRMMTLAASEAGKSSDWWRRVGAVLVSREVAKLFEHNRHLPSEHTPYIVGDPRDFISPGEHSEVCSAIHAEQAIIAEAARQGISLDGASLYVTVFPCPVCAKLIACSGIKSLFFQTGHSTVDGENILRSAGVGVFRVR